MKHHLSLFFVILFFLPSLACGAFASSSVNGSGKIVTQTVDVSNFDRVSLDGSGDVYIEQGETENLTIETDDNILPWLDTRVKANELVLSMKPGQNINPSRDIVYRLTVKDLNGISLQGSGNFFIETLESNNTKILVSGSGDVLIKGLTATSLSIDLLGSGNITVDDVHVNTVDTSVKGSGDIKLEGKATSQKVAVSGSGNYLAEDLETTSADITVPGSAGVTVWVNDDMKVNINGSGNVRYYGKPNIDQNVLGSGNIISLGEK